MGTVNSMYASMPSMPALLPNRINKVNFKGMYQQLCPFLLQWVDLDNWTWLLGHSVFAEWANNVCDFAGRKKQDEIQQGAFFSQNNVQGGKQTKFLKEKKGPRYCYTYWLKWSKYYYELDIFAVYTFLPGKKNRFCTTRQFLEL